MPIHDWTTVEAGIFHHFHHAWIGEISRALNGLLPSEFYAMAEQRTGESIPDVLTLHGPAVGGPGPSAGGGPSVAGPDDGGSVAVEVAPPRVRFRAPVDQARYYALRAKRVVVRHVTGDRVVAVVEVVSPGNKSSVAALDDFVGKAWALISAGVHLLAVDLFPPTARDPEGLHAAVWGASDPPVVRPPGQVLTCAAYRAAGADSEAFVEPVAVGDPLPDMPVFLTAGRYVPVPLDRTYAAAWDAVPRRWRDVVAPPAPAPPR